MYAGTIIGDKYRLEEKIGEGGMAVVWRALHTTLRRPVAVKFVELSGSESENQRKRFLREAMLAASIRHRCVVDIVDFGQMPDGQPYMIMEHLTGETLGDRMRRDPPLSQKETLRLFDMVMGGLTAIHEGGIVHRDLKPDNIFLLQDGEGVLPKLMDFGISRAASRESQRPAGLQPRPLTEVGLPIGTPEYMSPEQARGVAHIDARTDIFSMGVMLYEALTGESPFLAETVSDILIKVIRDPATPLSEFDVDPSLAGVVENAMAKDPEERFESAKEMRMAMRAAARVSLYDAPEITSAKALPVVPTSDKSPAGADSTDAPPVPAAGPCCLVLSSFLERGLRLSQ